VRFDLELKYFIHLPNPIITRDGRRNVFFQFLVTVCGERLITNIDAPSFRNDFLTSSVIRLIPTTGGGKGPIKQILLSFGFWR